MCLFKRKGVCFWNKYMMTAKKLKFKISREGKLISWKLMSSFRGITITMQLETHIISITRVIEHMYNVMKQCQENSVLFSIVYHGEHKKNLYFWMNFKFRENKAAGICHIEIITHTNLWMFDIAFTLVWTYM